MKKIKGFTLIELLIAVAIISILSVIGVVSYKSYIIKLNRSAGIQAVHTNIQFMEQQYLQNGVYSDGAKWPELPLNNQATNNKSIYKIKFTSATASKYGYTIVAIPICGTVQADDGCICGDKDGNISINAPASCNNATTRCACTDL